LIFSWLNQADKFTAKYLKPQHFIVFLLPSIGNCGDYSSLKNQENLIENGDKKQETGINRLRYKIFVVI
jgi:hypothetical protein